MKIKGNVVGFFIFSVLSLFFMVLIFLFSYQSAESSSASSESVYDIFIRLTSFDFISHGVFRKIAHFCEYAALGFSVSGAIYFYYADIRLIKSVVICLVYAFSDEIHQYFVPERACRLFDVFVDGCGSVFGFFVFWLLFFIKNKCFSKRRYFN